MKRYELLHGAMRKCHDGEWCDAEESLAEDYLNNLIISSRRV